MESFQVLTVENAKHLNAINSVDHGNFKSGAIDSTKFDRRDLQNDCPRILYNAGVDAGKKFDLLVSKIKVISNPTVKVFEESAVYLAESMVCDSLQENCSNHTVSDWDRFQLIPLVMRRSL